MPGVWTFIPGTQTWQAMAEKILLQIALSDQQKKAAERAKSQTMMVDKEPHDQTKIYLSGGDFCRRSSLAFLAEFRRRSDGNWNQYFICNIGVLVIQVSVT
jgi:hypothetical protein